MPAMHTTLIEADVKRIMSMVNRVWSQAGIQFEIESIGPTNALPLPQEMRLRSEFDRVVQLAPCIPEHPRQMKGPLIKSAFSLG